MPSSVSLTLAGIEKKLGGNPILRGIDLEVPAGQLTVLVGPSGCGKSTLLRTVAGLEEVDAGTITLGERDVTHLPPRDRDLGMVFQSYALYPHLTVRENLAFGLSLRGADRALVTARVKEASEMLGLGTLLDRLPKALSGGQRQRVAMGRAIARRPPLFLFDEPLSNLDAALRAEVRVQIKKLHAELGATMLYVTHDQVEAMTLADQLVVLRAGRIEQVGSPLDVYARPVSRFVAGFLGTPTMNFVSTRIEDDRARAEGLTIAVPAGLPERMVLGVRPEDVRPTATGAEPDVRFTVEVVEAMGFETYAHGHVAGAPFVARLDGGAEVARGDTLELTLRHAHYFDPETDLAIRTDPSARLSGSTDPSARLSGSTDPSARLSGSTDPSARVSGSTEVP